MSLKLVSLFVTAVTKLLNVTEASNRGLARGPLVLDDCGWINIECIAVNTSIHDAWVWGFPQVLDATRFISALAYWKFGSGERH